MLRCLWCLTHLLHWFLFSIVFFNVFCSRNCFPSPFSFSHKYSPVISESFRAILDACVVSCRGDPSGEYADPPAQGRATVATLQETKSMCGAQHFGDQEWSPSLRATRDPGGRSFLTATLREAKSAGGAHHLSNQDWLPSRSRPDATPPSTTPPPQQPIGNRRTAANSIAQPFR